MKIKGTIPGLDTLTQGLAEFSKSMRNKIIRKGMNAVTQPLLKSAKGKCKSKLIRKSLGRKVKTYPSGITVGVIFPRPGFDQVIDGITVKPTKIAHLLEGGRGPVSVKKATVLFGHGQFWGRQVGSAAAQPFMRPAYEEGKESSKSIMAQKCKEEITTEARKLAAKLAAKGK